MNKKDLEMYIDLVINEEDDKANALISKIMSEETKKRYRDMLISEGDLDVDVVEPDAPDEEVISTPAEPAEVEVEGEEKTDETSDDTDSVKAKINYQFNDIKKDMDRLRSLFNDISNTGSSEEETPETEEEEVEVAEDDSDASPLTYANSEENIFSDNDKIDESLELSPVKVDGKTSKEVGAGKAVKTDDKSVLDANARNKKGEPSSSKAENDANGNGKLETAPAVKPAPYKSTNVLDLEKVSDKGDETAELNSKEGFGSDDADSPLSKIKL